MALPKHTLVVESFAPMRKIINKQLTQLGFDGIYEAVTIEQASQRLNSGSSWDLVICSSTVGNDSGLEFLDEVRLDPRWETLPFIIISTSRNEVYVRQTINKGVSAFISKPFTGQMLRERIERIGVVP